MVCRECGNEDITVIKVYRNRERKNGKWIFNELKDTRMVICSLCGERFKTTTVMDAVIVMKNHKRYEQDINTGDLNLFEDNL